MQSINTISNYIISNNNNPYFYNAINTIINYIMSNNNNSLYFNNSIYTISSTSTVYFKYASQNYCIQNYIPVNSDINLQNNFNSTAISSPTIINGICHGSGDGATYSTFNLGIASWYCIEFIDSCYRKCAIYFDVRSGNINQTGTHTCL